MNDRAAGIFHGRGVPDRDSRNVERPVYVLANSGYRVGTDDIFRQFAAVPEPETWATMIVGFGMIGFGMRQGKRRTTPTVSA